MQSDSEIDASRTYESTDLSTGSVDKETLRARASRGEAWGGALVPL